MGMKPRARGRIALRDLFNGLREHALAMPEATEEFPWGDRAAKVRGKVFAFLGSVDRPGAAWKLTVKLPESGTQILTMPFAKPTGYGLGKSGWVTLTCSDDELLPLEMIKSFVVESYRAVAPKKLAALV